MIRAASAGAVAVLIAAAIGVRASADSIPQPATATPSPVPYPCNNINAYVTRPTVSTSVCPVPPHQAVLETGYSNTATTGVGANSTTNVPQAFVHTGIGPRIEFNFTPPSLESTNNGFAKTTGSSDPGFGVKGILGYTPRVQYGVGATMTVPTGSAAYTNGANTYAFVVNGTYVFAGNLSAFGTAGFDSLVGTGQNGNLARFFSFIPSLGVSYSLPSNWYLFGEAASFGHVAPNVGSRSLLDYGIQKVTGHVQFDAEAGNALNALNGSRLHYVGAGVSVLFGKQ